jgi:hypothetical protein
MIHELALFTIPTGMHTVSYHEPKKKKQLRKKKKNRVKKKKKQSTALKMAIQLVVAMNSPRPKNYRTRLNGTRSSWKGIFTLAGF